MSQVADTGTEIVLTVRDAAGVVIDLTGSNGQIIIRRPDGTRAFPDTELSDAPTDGTLHCTTLLSTFALQGAYQIQGTWTNEAGLWHTSIASVYVRGNL